MSLSWVGMRRMCPTAYGQKRKSYILSLNHKQKEMPLRVKNDTTLLVSVESRIERAVIISPLF